MGFEKTENAKFGGKTKCIPGNMKVANFCVCRIRGIFFLHNKFVGKKPKYHFPVSQTSQKN